VMVIALRSFSSFDATWFSFHTGGFQHEKP
jgi:hypothetical protein